MSAVRDSRALVPLEVIAVLAIAIAPLPALMPAAVPLFAAGTLSRWLRKRSWAEVARGGGSLAVGVGALTGALALAAALVAGTPAIELLGGRAIEWSSYPIVRGNSMIAVLAVYVAVTAIATELALRGWIVERVLELSPGPAILPVLVGGLAEALITPGDLAARIGGGVFGIGLGWMYVAGGRSVIAPVAARVVFQLGALLLEWLQLIG